MFVFVVVSAACVNAGVLIATNPDGFWRPLIGLVLLNVGIVGLAMCVVITRERDLR